MLQWSVSFPTYWGVPVQWGGGYLGFTVGSASSCPVQNVSWTALSLSGRMLLASENAMVRHGASPNQVRAFMVAFWKAVLRMSRATHHPQLRDAGDWIQPGHTLQSFIRHGTFRQQEIG